MSFSIHAFLVIRKLNIPDCHTAPERLKMISVGGNPDDPVSIESGCLRIFMSYKAREGNKER